MPQIQVGVGSFHCPQVLVKPKITGATKSSTVPTYL